MFILKTILYTTLKLNSHIIMILFYYISKYYIYIDDIVQDIFVLEICAFKDESLILKSVVSTHLITPRHFPAV